MISRLTRGSRAAEAEFDALLADAAGGCDCGHDHEHGVLGHPPVPDCAVEGAGVEGIAADSADCPHTCATCVLSQLR